MGVELDSSTPPTNRTYTEIFNEAFPYYLAMGMSYEEFWEKDPFLVIAYRKAKEIKDTRKNEMAWLSGAYVYDALTRVAPMFNAFSKDPHAIPYLEKPFPITKHEIREQRAIEKEKTLAEASAKFGQLAVLFNSKRG